MQWNLIYAGLPVSVICLAQYSRVTRVSSVQLSHAVASTCMSFPSKFFKIWIIFFVFSGFIYLWKYRRIRNHVGGYKRSPKNPKPSLAEKRGKMCYKYTWPTFNQSASDIGLPQGSQDDMYLSEFIDFLESTAALSGREWAGMWYMNGICLYINGYDLYLG